MVQLLPANYAHILIVEANPEPDEIPAVLYSHGPVSRTNPGGPVSAYIFEPERRVAWICFQEFEVAASHLLHQIGQLVEVLPEIWRRPVHLDVLQIP